MEDKQQLENLYHRAWTAMIAKDKAELESVHAPEFVLVHMTGLHQSRSQYIASILNGELNYYEESTDRVLIDINGGDTAIVTGQSKVLASVYGGGKHRWNLQLRFTAKKDGGKWIFTHCAASTYR